MHEMHLVIKIWSPIKSNSHFYPVAARQNDLTEQDKTSGLRGEIHDVSFQTIM